MKIGVQDYVLKDVVSRAKSALAKKSVMPMLTSLLFIADAGKIKVCATDTEQHVEIDMRGDIRETGAFLVAVEAIERVTSMKGYIAITCDETAFNNGVGSATFAAEKKKSKIAVSSADSDTITCIVCPPLENSAPVLNTDAEELKSVATDVLPFSSSNPDNKIFNTVNFNLKNERYETLDGHVAAYRKIKGEIMDTSIESLTMMNYHFATLKKILAEGDVEIFKDDKYIKVVGEDFTYVSRQCEGKYFNLSNFYNAMMRCDIRFTTEVKPFAKVIGEYAKIKTHDNKCPVDLFTQYGSLHTHIRTVDYETCDSLEYEGNNFNEDNFFIILSPIYMKDILNAFKYADEIKVLSTPCQTGSFSKNAIYFRGYDDDLTIMLLPINVMENQVENARKFAT